MGWVGLLLVIRSFFVEYLTSEGVLAREKATFVKSQAESLIRLAVINPLTKEEFRRLKELFEKDELTYEEAVEFRDLARKVVWEYMDRPEAWKLHLYASIMVGHALCKMREEREKEEKRKRKRKRRKSSKSREAE